MKWTKYRIFLAILLVISGTASTLLSKWTTTEKAKNSIGIEENFNHPFLQASGYFLGEFICLIIYYVYKYIQTQYVSISCFIFYFAFTNCFLSRESVMVSQSRLSNVEKKSSKKSSSMPKPYQ